MSFHLSISHQTLLCLVCFPVGDRLSRVSCEIIASNTHVHHACLWILTHGTQTFRRCTSVFRGAGFRSEGERVRGCGRRCLLFTLPCVVLCCASSAVMNTGAAVAAVEAAFDKFDTDGSSTIDKCACSCLRARGVLDACLP